MGADPPPIRPLVVGPSLAERVADALRSEILAGRYAPGGALPGEHAMAAMFGVSRTVMREAVSRLKAEGRVQAHMGRGVFVAADPPPTAFRIDPAAHADLDAVLLICELRMGFEAEAAALAARRRTASDLRELRAAFAAMDAAVTAGDMAREVEEDVRLHRAIAVATHNPHYAAFFESLGRFLRENITVTWRRSEVYVPSGEAAQAEHRAIVEAIAAREVEAARAAARTHVANTAARISAARRRRDAARHRHDAARRRPEAGRRNT